MNPEIQKISTNFSKGLNLSIGHTINPEECQQADNFLFSNGGAFVREGTLLNASLPAPIVAFKKHYKKDGTSYIAAFAGGQVYISYTSGVFTNVSCETLVSGDISIAAYDDYLYFSNLSNVVKSFDGSSIDNAGLSSPILIKYLGNFENGSGWITSGFGGGTVTLNEDSTYLHVDKGTKSLKLGSNASGGLFTNASNILNLSYYYGSTVSPTNDLIQVFMIPQKKSDISSITLDFINSQTGSLNSAPRATVTITNLSSWVYCSNDGWSMTHTVPKTLFTTTSGFNWGSCVAQIKLVGNSTFLSVDNLRLTRTPPQVNAVLISGGGLFFGSSASKTDRYVTHGFFGTLYDIVQGANWASVSTSGTAGIVLDGTTYYKETYVKYGPGGIEVESNPTFQSSGCFLSSYENGHYISKLTDLTIAPADSGVVGRKIYRRNSTESVMRHAYTIADNTTSSFIDNVPNGALGSILDETRWPPPNAKFIYTASNQQTYYLNIKEADDFYSSRVRFSQSYAPYYVPIENVFDVSPNDGSEITGIFEFMNLIHILKGSSTWMIDNGNLSQVHNTYGCIAAKSLAVGPQEVFWLADEGIIKYSLRFKNISLDRSRIDPFIKNIDRTLLQKAAGIYYRGFYLLAISDGNSSENNTVLCYDNANDIWSIFPNIQVNCWDVWSGAKDGYRLFYGNNSGLVCEFLKGNCDISTPIPWAIKTKEFGNPTPTMSLREAYLYAKNLDVSGHIITVTPYYDFAGGTGTVKTLTSGPTKFDLAAYDGAGFISVGYSGDGRIQIYRTDIYGKQESLR